MACFKLSTLFCILVLFASVHCGTFTDGTFSLNWGVENGVITFAMTAKTTGWVSFGISRNGPSPHANADTYVGWVAANGVVYVYDSQFFADRDKPYLDTEKAGKSSITLVSGWETGGSTTIVFKRPLNTGDTQDVTITATTYNILWATSTADGEDPFSFTKHNRDGDGNVNFLNSPNFPPTTPPTPAPTLAPTTPGTTPGKGSFTSSSGSFKLDWSLSTDGKSFTFTMAGKTTGYISFGISSTGTPAPHQAADMYVGWVVGTAVTLLDTKGIGSSIPTYDATQNLASVTGSESGGWTTITFTRPVTATDTANDVTINNAKMSVLWAFGTGDGTGTGAAASYSKHSAIGTTSINFFAAGSGSTTPTTTPTITPTDNSFSSSGGDFSFSWEWSTDKADITITMKAKTTGWLSLGLSTTGSPYPHQDADMYTGWISNGKVTLLDTSGTSSSTPDYDITQNIQLISGKEEAGETTIIFTRKRDLTGKTGVSINDASLFIVWAYADNDGIDQNTYSKHSATGAGKVNFYTGGGNAQAGISEFTAAEVVLVITFGLLLIWVVFRFLRQCIKYHTVKKAVDFESSTVELRYREPTPNITITTARNTARNSIHYRFQENGYDSSSTDIKSQYSSKRNTQRTLVRQTLPPPPPPMEKQDSTMDQKRAEAIGAKSTGSRFGNFLSGICMQRLPYSQISVSNFFLAIFFIGINLVGLFLGSGTRFASKTGSLSAVNSFLVALPATRNSVLVFLLGIPFDRVIMYHRWLGYFTVSVNIVHTVLEIVDWATAKENLIDLIFVNLINMYGFIAFSLSTLLFLTSVEYLRRRHFEFFFYAHFMFIPYYVLGALHSKEFFPYAVAAGVFYGLDRLIRMFWGIMPFRATLRIKGLEYDDREYHIIQVTLPKNPLGIFFKIYKPGQYAFINFPQISFLEWHPYSISSGPEEEILEFHIRSLGDHTSKIMETLKAQKYVNFWARVDGPYGDLRLNLRRVPNLVFVSGGIGFSPVIGMLKDLYRTGNLYHEAVKRPSHLMETIRVLWVARSPGQYTWFNEEMNMFMKASEDTDLPSFHADIFITSSQVEDPNFQALNPYENGKSTIHFHTGRPDFDMYTSQNLSFTKANMVFVCGPEQMVSSLWDSCSQSSRNGAKVHFHHEIFEF